MTPFDKKELSMDTKTALSRGLLIVGRAMILSRDIIEAALRWQATWDEAEEKRAKFSPLRHTQAAAEELRTLDASVRAARDELLAACREVDIERKRALMEAREGDDDGNQGSAT